MSETRPTTLVGDKASDRTSMRITPGPAAALSDLIADAAAVAGCELRLAVAPRCRLVDAEAAGRGGRDYSTVLRHIAAAGNG